MNSAAAGIFHLALRRHFWRGHAAALAVMLGLLAVILFSFVRGANGPEHYLGFSVEFYFTFLLPLLAFIGGGGAWRDELKPEAADYFLLRGVPRARYLTLRYLAHVLCAELDFAFALGLLVLAGAIGHVPGLGAAVPRMIATQILAVAAFSAFGFLCAALSSRWVIIGLLYGAVVEVGLGNVPLAINRFAMSREVRALLRPLAQAAASGSVQPPSPASAGVAALYLLLFAGACVALAALRFDRQELAGGKSE